MATQQNAISREQLAMCGVSDSEYESARARWPEVIPPRGESRELPLGGWLLESMRNPSFCAAYAWLQERGAVYVLSVRDEVLRGFSLLRSSLSGAYFNGCDLRGADLGTTVFRHTSFSKCDFRGAKMADAVFERCLFVDCRFDPVVEGQATAPFGVPGVDIVRPLFGDK